MNVTFIVNLPQEIEWYLYEVGIYINWIIFPLFSMSIVMLLSGVCNRIRRLHVRHNYFICIFTFPFIQNPCIMCLYIIYSWSYQLTIIFTVDSLYIKCMHLYTFSRSTMSLSSVTKMPSIGDGCCDFLIFFIATRKELERLC